MAHLTNPIHSSEASSSQSFSPVNTINILDSNLKEVTICLPLTIQTTEDAIKAYSEYLNFLIVFSIPSTFSPADIPSFREKCQIPIGVRIRATGPDERAYYFSPGEVCFYESAFEHGLRFPMDEHVKELLVALDLAPVQVPPNMWSCLVGSILIFIAISAGSHEITEDEFLTLFQCKDGGQRNMGTLSCSSRLGAPKIIHDLPGSISNWKRRFFYISDTGWEHHLNRNSTIELKVWFTEQNTLQRRPSSIVSEWIEDAKRFSVKNYAELVAPEMLWRFGLGPRPRDMDPTILSVMELNLVKPFVKIIQPLMSI